jgi:hypothetical protein
MVSTKVNVGLEITLTMSRGEVQDGGRETRPMRCRAERR